MNELVIDLESIPNMQLPKEILDIAAQKMNSKRSGNKDILRFQSLTPEFGQIITIGVMRNEYISVFTGDERKVLESFWSAMFEPYTRIVGFNSKGFDIPYIKKRSAILGITPSFPPSTRRYDTERHFDCMEVLSNFGANDYMSLSAYCKIFSIPYNDEISGADIFSLWKKGDIENIKKHCAADVKAIWELYQKIKDFF